nr:hypothetical protein [Tanacetum cinerariifolium]
AMRKQSMTMEIEGVGKADLKHLQKIADEEMNQAFELKMKSTTYINVVLKRVVDDAALQLRSMIENFVTGEMVTEIAETSENAKMAAKASARSASFAIVVVCKIVVGGGMERGFLSQKGSGVGRGVKEKNLNRNKTNNALGIGVSTKSDDAMNEDTPVGVASAVQEGITPLVVDMTFEMGKQYSLDDTTRGWFECIITKLATPLMLDSYTSDMCMQSWGMSSYARVMTELRADVKLKYNIFVAMLKITKEGHYTCNVRVEYEWKPPRCSSFKVFGRIHEECPKNTGAGEKKTMKKLSQTSRGVLVGPKTGFKPQKEYRHVLIKLNASSSGNKRNGTINLVNKGATSSESSSMNIANDGEFASNTPIGVKIDKIERQIYEGKLRLLDNDGNPLVSTGIVKSDSEVEVVFDETANLRISTSGKDGSDKGYGTSSLLE